MEVTKGKLVNLVSKAELPFSINPAEYRIESSFDYQVEPRVGQSTPLVAYRCGNPSVLTFSLVLDRDADDKLNFGKVDSFLKSLHKIDESTFSTPRVEFKMGTLQFTGYTRRYDLRAVRFDAKGEISGARLDVEVVSDGTYEGNKG